MKPPPEKRLLLRAAILYGLIYLCWLPLQEIYIDFLAAISGRILRLIGDPPLITALQPLGSRIASHPAAS